MAIKNIMAPEDRIYSIGSKVTEDGALMLDVYDHKHSELVFGNIPIRELIEHLNTIEGVTASYAPPVKLPQGIGAVVSPPRSPHIKLVRVLTDEDKNWRQNVKGDEGAWYTDAAVKSLISDEGYVVVSEGVQP